MREPLGDGMGQTWHLSGCKERGEEELFGRRGSQEIKRKVRRKRVLREHEACWRCSGTSDRDAFAQAVCMDNSPALAGFGGQWLPAETVAAAIVGQEPVLWDYPARPSTSRSNRASARLDHLDSRHLLAILDHIFCILLGPQQFSLKK